jgi:NAD-dependent deacetylase
MTTPVGCHCLDAAKEAIRMDVGAMKTSNPVDEAARRLRAARKTVVFTGAGVSTESGIPDFRSAEGLWSRYDPAEYATLSAFARHPAKVWNMLAELERVLEAEPNPGHRALARLEAGGGVAGIITQNVDGLHQAAGSRIVVEYHGSNRTFTCIACGNRFPRAVVREMAPVPGTRIPRPDPCPAEAPERCMLKPDVVFFDEMIPPAAVSASAELIQGADLILVIGTSCEVFPAADLPRQVRGQGGAIVEINLEPASDLNPDLLLQGRFGQVMPAVLEAWERLKA